MFIREFDGHKYKIHVSSDETKVIALSSFAGKAVSGIAKCHPNDTPDLEKGIMLAILRCNQKIAQKKVNRATNMLRYDIEYLSKMTDHFNIKIEKMTAYLKDSKMDLELATSMLNDYKNNEI